MAKPVHNTEVEVRNPDGLHMRPAMQFVDVASQFTSNIEVSNGEYTVDGKSIMQVTMLAATCGTKLLIKATGEDAEEAVKALQELFSSRLAPQPPPAKTPGTRN
ncbi:MAG TPA: HPr family phosphocarrier protein [Sedimentisphaerales bacterium]|nr:HPr family phosphocarrier protein [Sedimentisphaerales bacterium]